MLQVGCGVFAVVVGVSNLGSRVSIDERARRRGREEGVGIYGTNGTGGENTVRKIAERESVDDCSLGSVCYDLHVRSVVMVLLLDACVQLTIIR